MLKKQILILLMNCLMLYSYCESSQKNCNPYQTYKSCANPVFCPNIGDSFFYDWSIRNKSDIPSEKVKVNKDYFARYIQYYFFRLESYYVNKQLLHLDWLRVALKFQQ